MANGTEQVENTNSGRAIGLPQKVAVAGKPAIGKKEKVAGIGKKDIGNNNTKGDKLKGYSLKRIAFFVTNM